MTQPTLQSTWALATAERVVNGVRVVAAGGGLLSSKHTGELLRHVARLHHEVLKPRGIGPFGISSREADVLRLMADGLGTAEIAVTLCLSETTVKNVIVSTVRRLGLRNRQHAVAYVIRTGLIR